MPSCRRSRLPLLLSLLAALTLPSPGTATPVPTATEPAPAGARECEEWSGCTTRSVTGVSLRFRWCSRHDGRKKLELHFRNNGSSTARFKFRLFWRAGLGEFPPNEAVAGDEFSKASGDYTLRPEQDRRPWGFFSTEQAQSQWTVCFYDVENE